MPELLLGCGNCRTKKIANNGNNEWKQLVTLDIDPDVGADVVHDIGNMPLPFPDDHFDEIHAYDVLEHVGAQGDWRFFFRQWDDFWRMLKPGGLFVGMSPSPTSPWAFGDPGHTRVFAPGLFLFLNRPAYAAEIGKSSMTDYRPFFRCDFDIDHIKVHREFDNQLIFALKAVKPART